MNKDNILKRVLVIVSIILISLYFTLNGDSESKLGASVKIEKQIIYDTIIKYDTIKIKTKNEYKAKRQVLITSTPKQVDSIFNQTFPIDSGDTSNYTVGYTQFKKAIDSEYKRNRDSVILIALTKQLESCTTGVNTIVDIVDSSEKSKAKNDYTRLALVAVVSAIIAFLLAK